MAGIFIQLLISWILLRSIERKNLEVLGLIPSATRIKDFAAGLLFPLVYYTALFFFLAWLVKNPYHLNPGYTPAQFMSALWYLFKSVAFETLIFNGALLYILIRRVGATRGFLISGIGFGIYHWFSWNLFGQPGAMIVVFLTTGLAGYLWSMSFHVSRSVYLPFALHLGTDIAMSIIFSKDKTIGLQLLKPEFEKDPASPGVILSVLGIALYFLGFPLLTYIYLRKRAKKQDHLNRMDLAGRSSEIQPVHQQVGHDA